VPSVSHRARPPDEKTLSTHRRQPGREENRRLSRQIEESLFKRKALDRPETRYNLFMQFAVLAMRVLEVMFFAGLAGSTVVVLISFVEDGKELFGKDEPPESRAG
jgi:hypothetical protein